MLLLVLVLILILLGHSLARHWAEEDLSGTSESHGMVGSPGLLEDIVETASE